MIDRIRARDSFHRLRREGSRTRVAPLWCSYLHDPDVTPPQVAFAIGRTVGTAVQRNRSRRRLRAILADSDVPPGLLLIGADRSVVELSFDELTSRVHTLLDRVATA